MAAAKMNLMMCSVCLDEFKDPRALPCLHTFCLECLVGLCASSKQRGNVRCPMCKEEHRIPQNGAWGFRKDFRIKNFMDVNKTDAHAKARKCQQHPALELTHYCEDVDCNKALCIQCVTQDHQNHQIRPMKSICEAKLSHLRMMQEAIELNHQIVKSTKKKLEENKSEMHARLRKGVNELISWINQEGLKNAYHIDKMISEAHDVITERQNDIQKAEEQLRVLQTKFSDTIPNIVRANTDKHLDADFSGLYEMLNNWKLKYSLLKVVDLQQFTKNISQDWVVKIPEQSVKGVSVTLPEPVAPEVHTPKKRIKYADEYEEEADPDFELDDSDEEWVLSND